jgi:hypothetical protein
MAALTHRFSKRTANELAGAKALRIRAGDGDHRFISIWCVVVDGRLFVRSWTMKPRGWYRTFQEEPRGAIEIGARKVSVRARAVRSEKLLRAIDEAYAEKYATPGARVYVRGFAQGRRRATTTELVPA